MSCQIGERCKRISIARDELRTIRPMCSNAGLAIEGELVLETVKGREAYALLKKRALRGLVGMPT
jgi:hypothetical protein